MCGRYRLVAEWEKFKRKYPLYADISWDEFVEKYGYEMRPEIFPGTPILAINKEHKLENLWWTIRDAGWDGKVYDTINAKAQNLMRVAMFKNAFLTDRVLIPATALYEWQVQADKSKVKFEITFDEPIFSFAGIARDCEIKGETKRCGVIITTTANEIFAEVHNVKQRQAVVIREEDYDAWLDPATPYEKLKPMFEPLPAAETHAKPVEKPQANLFG